MTTVEFDPREIPEEKENRLAAATLEFIKSVLKTDEGRAAIAKKRAEMGL